MTRTGAEGRPGGLPGRLASGYLALLPSGHLLLVVVAGALATGTDLALGALVLGGGLALVLGRRRPLPRGVVSGLSLLGAYAAWVALSALWGPHPAYALAKGGAALALVGGAWVLSSADLRWTRLADAWLVGAALALVLTALAAVVSGSPGLRVAYQGGAIAGLPFPRVRGPFLHPSMAGDYWAVSGALLWARWPDLRASRGGWAVALAAGLAVALALTVSTAWIGAGAALMVVARGGWLGRRATAACRLGGVALVAVGLVAVLMPVTVPVGPLTVRTGAVRPAIWASSLRAVAASPVVGVGAAPYLAEAPDPLDPGTLGLWDAHDTYLSLLGQFGLVGAALALGGVALLVRAVAATPPDRVRTGLLAALAAVGAHGLFVAGEDFRHAWALLGLAAAWAAAREP